ncbi:MAG: hypothetical protein AAGI30_02785 [Planctomycetota bacterium]
MNVHRLGHLIRRGSVLRCAAVVGVLAVAAPALTQDEGGRTWRPQSAEELRASLEQRRENLDARREQVDVWLAELDAGRPFEQVWRDVARAFFEEVQRPRQNRGPGLGPREGEGPGRFGRNERGEEDPLLAPPRPGEIDPDAEPVAPEELLGLVRLVRPDFARRLERIRERFPDRFQRFVEVHGPVIRARLENDGPGVGDPGGPLPPEVARLARAAADAEGDERAAATAALREAVAREHARRLRSAEWIAQRLEQRLEELRAELEKQTSEREARIDELTNELIDRAGAGERP